MTNLKKAEDSYERGMSMAVCGLVLMVALGVIMAVLIRYTPTNQPIIATLVLPAFLAGAVAAFMFKSAFRTMRAEAITFGGKAEALQRYLDDAKGFITSFRPPEGDVCRILQAAAYEVRWAHEAKVKFYENGIKGMALPGSADPETNATAAEAYFKNREAQLEEYVKRALAGYRELWGLSDKQGYTNPSSWKALAYLPASPEPQGDGLQTLDEARREQKLGVYAEGANEQPGQ